MRTSMRTILLGTGAAGLAFAGLVGSPAANADDTTVTFDIPAGSLAIDAAATTTLDTVTNTIADGLVVSGSLGQVTVDDTRNVTAAWTATAAAGTFTQQDDASGNPVDPGSADTIDGSAATFVSAAAADAVSGLALFTPGVLPGEIGKSMTVTGNNQISFTPSMRITVPANTAAGTYSGTVTTSVS